MRLRSAVLGSVLVVCSMPVLGAIPPIEREALIALYNSTNGDGWTRRDNWKLGDGTECTWFGVTCDANRLTVTGISLRANRLTGTIPSQIGNLAGLEVLTLDSNSLSGPLPSTITNLGQLRTLQLNSNDVTGEIPRDIGRLRGLQTLGLFGNPIEGTIPESLGELRELTYIQLASTNLSGSVPLSLLQLTKLGTLAVNDIDARAFFERVDSLPALTFLWLEAANLSGPIPVERLLRIRNLSTLLLHENSFDGPIPPGFSRLPLTILDLAGNRLTGSVPAELGLIPTMQYLTLDENDLTGEIPASIWTLPRIINLGLSRNRLSGTIPAQVGALTTLEQLGLGYNRFTGPIPSEIGRLTKLTNLYLNRNEFSGEIPREIGNLTELQQLYMGFNLLSGSIPSEIGRLTKLVTLELQGNALRGEVPAAIAGLGLIRFGLIGNNALVAQNPATAQYLDAKFQAGAWKNSQTVPPTSVDVVSTGAFSAEVTWTPKPFQSGPGGYQVSVRTQQSGPYVPLVTTSDQRQKGVVVPGLQPTTRYYAIVRTVTFPFGYQKNTLFSDPTPEFSFTTSAPTTEPGRAAVLTVPEVILQQPQSGGGTSLYRVLNVGGQPLQIRLEQSGDFFTQSPLTFSLGPGALQDVTLVGIARPQGGYSGTSTVITQDGSRLAVPVRLFSSPQVGGGARLSVSSNRLDISTSASASASGSFVVTNVSDVPFVGVTTADVEWINPPSTLIRIEPGASETVTVTVDPAKRPDPELLTGTVVGTVSLVALAGGAGKGTPVIDGSTTKPLTTVSVTLTTATNPLPEPIPPLGPNDFRFFIPGVGHTFGTVGLFISDVSIFNSFGLSAVSDARLFYQRAGSTQALSAAIGSLGTSQSVLLGDIVKSVFKKDSEVGTLQVKTSSPEQLKIDAKVFNVSNAAGTYGTSIPVFRSDRAAATPEDRIFLTGLRRNATSYTNFFLQEMAGRTGSVSTTFYDAAGSVIGTRSDSLQPFALLQLGNVVPEGAVMATLTGGSQTRFQAFATPVDGLSGDTWAIPDWSRLNAFSPGEAVVVPVAGAAFGAGDTYFRTDIAITNSECINSTERNEGGCGTTDATLRYYINGGGVIERTIRLEPFHTVAIDDVVGTTFNAVGTIGYLVVQPAAGNLAVSSRTYTTVRGSASTYGSSVPTVARSAALRAGQSQRLASIDDAPVQNTIDRTPGTFRNNIGLLEVSGEPAKVRLTLTYLEARGKVAANIVAFKDVDLAPNQGVLLPLSSFVLGSARDQLGRIPNLKVQIEVTSATGGVIAYVTSVDNGTGDSVVRVE